MVDFHQNIFHNNHKVFIKGLQNFHQNILHNNLIVFIKVFVLVDYKHVERPLNHDFLMFYHHFKALFNGQSPKLIFNIKIYRTFIKLASKSVFTSQSTL